MPTAFKKQRELEEARKRGLAPLAVDKDGKEISPHIPNFINQAPWYSTEYAGPEEQTLQHQKRKTLRDDSESFSTAPRKIVEEDQGPRKKIRSGCCTNCGANTHTAKDCTERKRKVGAVYSKKNVAPDEVVHKTASNVSYDTKRDRWKGDVSDWQQIARNTLEEKASKRAEEERQRKVEHGGSDEEDDDVEAKAGDVRVSRARDQMPKFLINLDPKSALYDPKTHSMRANPYAGMDPEEARAAGMEEYVGDNEMLNSGESMEYMQQQVFLWKRSGLLDDSDEVKAGTEHITPTMAQLIYNQHKDEMRQLEQRSDMQLKYQRTLALEQQAKGIVHDGEEGGMLLYGMDGKARPVQPRVNDVEPVRALEAPQQPVGPSRAVVGIEFSPADGFFGDHTSVWGSHFDVSLGTWGYKCCKSTNKDDPTCGPRAAPVDIIAEGADEDALAEEMRRMEEEMMKQ